MIYIWFKPPGVKYWAHVRCQEDMAGFVWDAFKLAGWQCAFDRPNQSPMRLERSEDAVTFSYNCYTLLTLCNRQLQGAMV